MEIPTQQFPQQTVVPTKSNKTLVASFTIIVFLVAGYALAAKLGGLWPFGEQVAVSPTPSVDVSATPNATAGWKTYTYTSIPDMSFQVKYPPEWATPMQNDKPIVYLGKTDPTKGEEFIQISLGYDNPKSLSLNDWLAAQRWPLASGQKWTDIFYPIQNIDGYPAMMQEPTGTVYAVNGKLVLFIEPGTGFNRKIIPENIYLQILSTFKFTGATAGWKTHTNTEYSFTLQFPTGWEGYYAKRFTVQRSDFPAGAYFDGEFNKVKNNVYISFNMKDGRNDYPFFVINIYPKAYWLTVKDEPIFSRGYLGEQNGLVFAWNGAQEPPLDRDLLPLTKQVDQIISTFKFAE